MCMHISSNVYVLYVIIFALLYIMLLYMYIYINIPTNKFEKIITKKTLTCGS